MRFIGDVHGKMDRYFDIILGAPNSIQVGDYGIGFAPNLIQGPLAKQHRFIRGNHDHPALCVEQDGYIHDGTIEGDMMFIGGALSIDRAHRVEHVNWWKDEELSYSELLKMFDQYLKNKPRIMITHECPEAVADAICKDRSLTKYDDKSRTRQAFQNMWENHKPEIWIFGHWHESFDREILGTRFICLDELQYIDLEI